MGAKQHKMKTPDPFMHLIFAFWHRVGNLESSAPENCPVSLLGTSKNRASLAGWNRIQSLPGG
jgi:hypothetical protein